MDYWGTEALHLINTPSLPFNLPGKLFAQ